MQSSDLIIGNCSLALCTSRRLTLFSWQQSEVFFSDAPFANDCEFFGRSFAFARLAAWKKQKKAFNKEILNEKFIVKFSCIVSSTF